MEFAELVGGIARAARLRGLISSCLIDAYTENCGRFSDDLGDNNLTFAVSVIHNLRHLLDEAFVGEPGVVPSRPANSFQLEIDGKVAIHFYKAPSGPSDVGEIRFDESKKKIQLIAENSAQLAFVFDDAAQVVPGREPRHLIVIHAGTPARGFIGASIGAPLFSPVNGTIWLWRESLTSDGASSTPAAEPCWSPDTALPELIVELRDDAGERPGASEAS